MKRRTKKELNEFARGLGIEYDVGITKVDTHNAFANTYNSDRKKITIGYDWCKELNDGKLAFTMFHEEFHLKHKWVGNKGSVPDMHRQEIMCDIYAIHKMLKAGYSVEDAMFQESGMVHASHPSHNQRNVIMKYVADNIDADYVKSVTVSYNVPKNLVYAGSWVPAWIRRHIYQTQMPKMIGRLVFRILDKLEKKKPTHYSFTAYVGKGMVGFE